MCSGVVFAIKLARGVGITNKPFDGEEYISNSKWLMGELFLKIYLFYLNLVNVS